MFQNIWEAFSFLTILVSGRAFNQATMQRSVAYFPLVGLTLGILTSVITYFIFWYCAHAMLSALLYCVSMFFLTRGLHHDGLADIADAWGSHQRGDKFRQILKDSRVGSFGVIILVLYLLIYVTSVASIFDQILLDTMSDNSTVAAIFLLVFAPLWGRIGILMFPSFSKIYTLPHPDSDDNSIEIKTSPPLSAIMGNNHARLRLFIWLIPALFIFSVFLTWHQTILIIVLSSISFLALFTLAKREHGYNGDFLGAISLLWELSVFMSIFA